MRRYLPGIVGGAIIGLMCAFIVVWKSPWYVLSDKIRIECTYSDTYHRLYWVDKNLDLTQGIEFRQQVGTAIWITKYGPGACVRVH